MVEPRSSADGIARVVIFDPIQTPRAQPQDERHRYLSRLAIVGAEFAWSRVLFAVIRELSKPAKSRV